MAWGDLPFILKRREVIPTRHSFFFSPLYFEAAWGDPPFILKRREVISPLFLSGALEAAWGDLPFILKRCEVISSSFWSGVRWSPCGTLFFLSPLFWSGQRLCLLPQFLSPYRSKNLKQRKDKMFISISDSERYIFHKAWTLRLRG